MESQYKIKFSSNNNKNTLARNRCIIIECSESSRSQPAVFKKAHVCIRWDLTCGLSTFRTSQWEHKSGAHNSSFSKSELLTSDSVDCTVHTTESEVRSSDFEKLELRAPLLYSHWGVRNPHLSGAYYISKNPDIRHT